LNTVALNSHGDIRERYLPELLASILTTIAEKNVASIDSQLLVRLLIAAKAILNEVGQSAVVIDAGVVMRRGGEMTRCDETDSIDKPSPVAEEDAVKEQWRVENCLSSCQRLLAQICDWYCKERNAERLRAFHAISALMMEFADFPLYVLRRQENRVKERRQRLIPTNYPVWLSGLLNVLSLDEWEVSLNNAANYQGTDMSISDFYARANALDLTICVYVRSVSVAEQHAAAEGRPKRWFFVAIWVLKVSRIFSRVIFSHKN
uniref:RIH_assoc domain-containing protein n=1 Tax=Gongylonema pulchrum TaxID=637853 RepID=A0A183EJ49_9BILA